MPMMLGPWTVEDMESFRALGDRIGAQTVSDQLERAFLTGPFGSPRLFDLGATEYDFATLEDAWEARRRHPIYQWLEANENFRAAWVTFQKHRRRAQNGKLSEPTVEFKFLRVVVECAAFAFRSKWGGTTRYGATAPKRRSALAHARALTSLFREGVRLSDSAEQRQLETFLQSLQQQLQARDRKQYEGPRVTGTRALEFLAVNLVIEFGLRSPSIVQDIANMVGLSRERSTCERYVKAADERWRMALADALRNHQKSAKP